MSPRLRLGARTWRPPRWPWLVLAVLACGGFIALGRWQFERGEYRSAEWRAFEAPGEPRAVTADQLGTLPRFARIRIEGRLDGEHQFLLDNRVRDGRVGYEVLTPLVLADGTALLVNRGFVPGDGDRRRLPAVALEAGATGPLTLSGRLGMLPAAGLEAGRVPPASEGPWPRLTAFPSAEDLAAVLPWRLRPGLLLLDPDSGPGYAREWRAPGLDPTRHYGYAVQWWAFAALALVLLVVLNLEKTRPR